MIFLLPPSESKQVGGERKNPQLSFKQLQPTRTMLQDALVELSKDPAKASAALKLGPKQAGELAVNLDLAKPLVLPAIDRYTGVVYEQLKLGGLSKANKARAAKSLYIQSSLFGLISALDLIPNYRLSAGAKLPGVNLKKVWGNAHQGIWGSFQSEIVIDLRSKAYAALAPVPTEIKCYEVEVFSEDRSGTRKALNHFNKQAKGSFVRAALSAGPNPSKVSDLEAIAFQAGLGIEIAGNQLLLITNT